MLLTSLLHLLRGLNPVEVVNRHIGAFTCKRRAEEFAETAELGALVSVEIWKTT